jgi:hypothetical protein
MISFCGGTPKVIGTFLLKKLSDSSDVTDTERKMFMQFLKSTNEV